MSRRGNVINRVVLTVLGLLLLAAGGLGIAISVGAFGAWRAAYPVLPLELRTFPDGRPWFWWAVAAVLMLIAVLALLWLLTQFRTDRTNRLDLTTNALDGYTTLHASALTNAVEDEALGHHRCDRRVGECVRTPRAARVPPRGAADSADIGEVRTRLENEVVAHLREGVGDPGMPVSIELRPGASRNPQRSLT